ncbi:MAG: cyclic nucleotide-binding domain-containing protein [Anaerolineales bacterium]|jgi:CRP-like cAMP-binding protein|nr:cyclic nucleotide-binding domain-containing protein [Anaerolineales bacterium]
MISLERLQRFPFFAFMDEKELKAVATIARELQFNTGDVICEANTPADALFFLTRGNLPYYMVVTTENMPDYRKEYFIGEINPEEIFGISALIEPYRYTATLRADKPCSVIKIDASALRALCELDSYLSVGLMKAVAKAAMERLQMARVQLVAKMAELAN